jgi:hypothetical protein
VAMDYYHCVVALASKPQRPCPAQVLTSTKSKRLSFLAWVRNGSDLPLHGAIPPTSVTYHGSR